MNSGIPGSVAASAECATKKHATSAMAIRKISMMQF
jgi:hypothetical protein